MMFNFPHVQLGHIRHWVTEQVDRKVQHSRSYSLGHRVASFRSTPVHRKCGVDHRFASDDGTIANSPPLKNICTVDVLSEGLLWLSQ